MKLQWKKAVTAAAIAIAFSIGGVATAGAANAYTPSLTISGTPVPGQTNQITVSGVPSQFEGNSVRLTLTGNGIGAGSLASIVRTAETSTSVVKTFSGGAVPFSVSLPANATGTYTLVAVDLNNNQQVFRYQWVFGAAAGGSLSNTGENTAGTVAIWIGGGALLVVGGGIVAGTAIARRRKAEAASVATH